MTLFQTIVLSLTQGIAEFLPISSSGHLNVVQHFFNLKPSLAFDIFLNTATFVSVLFFFRKQVPYFIKNLPYIIVGSIPAALVGILFKDQIESVFANIKILPYLFLITSIFIFCTKFFKSKSLQMTYPKALIIGIFQAIAILPAVSRSGSTIFAALLLGLAPAEAFKFSFSLFIPASLGALVLSYKDLGASNFLEPNFLIAFLVTAIVGIFALNLLRKIIDHKKLWYFSFYTLALSIILFLTL